VELNKKGQTGDMSNTDKWIDVSVPLQSGMVHWPGDPNVAFRRISEIGPGVDANVTVCDLPAHTGTHMDAPCHFLTGKSGIDQFPLDVGIGAAKVIRMDSGVKVIGRAELEGRGIGPGERVLFRTNNSDERWHDQPFRTDYVGINATGAEFLVQSGVALVGVDYLSVGVFKGDGADTHRILLGAGIWIVEGLALGSVPEGKYEMICLPLRIVGSDGSPARVALRRR
jgi:arylformamidase